MTDKAVYLPYRAIPQQLEGEVRKCSWYMAQTRHHYDHQGALYASQVVIVRKKTREIWLCADYWKLNSTVVMDAFPLTCIDEALQAVHNCQWLTSFDMAQGYLQMPVEEADIQKTAFRAVSSGLYMSSLICHSGCLSLEVQFLLPHGDVSRRPTICDSPITPRQYLCILLPAKTEMLDHTELVFK